MINFSCGNATFLIFSLPLLSRIVFGTGFSPDFHFLAVQKSLAGSRLPDSVPGSYNSGPAGIPIPSGYLDFVQRH
jgi:hypothetical protein